jgi:hypothetical protein
LLESTREVIGLTLKAWESYNTTDLSQVSDLKRTLALHQQVKLYSSNRYLRHLLFHGTPLMLRIGWSTDILPLQENSYRYKLRQLLPPVPEQYLVVYTG